MNKSVTSLTEMVGSPPLLEESALAAFLVFLFVGLESAAEEVSVNVAFMLIKLISVPIVGEY